jgi:soluble lytic murein transglycosylase-like protein
MQRMLLGVLTICAVSLVSGGGGARLPAGAAAAGPVSARAGDEVRFGAEQAAAFVRRVNPTLSDAQVRRIASAIVRNSEKYGLAPELVTAVLWRESHARPWVRSPKGAVGLMQVMPHMFRPLEIAGNIATIESNVEAGCLILSDNIRRLGEEEGILAYFWGSEIRGAAYLERVREARAALSRSSES